MLVFHFQIQITALHLHTGKLMITATFSTSVVSSAEDLAGFFPQEKPTTIFLVNLLTGKPPQTCCTSEKPL